MQKVSSILDNHLMHTFNFPDWKLQLKKNYIPTALIMLTATLMFTFVKSRWSISWTSFKWASRGPCFKTMAPVPGRTSSSNTPSSICLNRDPSWLALETTSQRISSRTSISCRHWQTDTPACHNIQTIGIYTTKIGVMNVFTNFKATQLCRN